MLLLLVVLRRICSLPYRRHLLVQMRPRLIRLIRRYWMPVVWASCHVLVLACSIYSPGRQLFWLDWVLSTYGVYLSKSSLFLFMFRRFLHNTVFSFTLLVLTATL